MNPHPTLAMPFYVIAILGLMGAGCQRVEPLPGIVEGASMAPHWLGEHRLMICQDCQYPIRFQLDPTDAVTSKVVCPNCGYRDNALAASSGQAAQPVTIHPGLPIARWDVVASRIPNTKMMGIKRVVGLPGEQLEIRQGDVYVDGAISIKPWSVQRLMRILVYDSAYPPQGQKDHQRWLPADGGGLWCQPDDSTAGESPWLWQFEASQPSDDGQRHSTTELNWSWLRYQHWRCCNHPGQRYDRFPLEDIDSFNPSLQRSLHPMVDFCFEIKFQVSADARWGWRLLRGADVYECQLDCAQGRLFVRRVSAGHSQLADEAQLMEASLPEALLNLAGSNLLEVSTFDRQLMVLINDHPLLAYPLAELVGEPTSDFLQLGACQGQINLETCRLWRDIHYLPLSSASFQLPPDSFFLLGDNAAVSVDSRQWKPPGIKRQDILGTVKAGTN